jgi:Raf kinase inhibitor-like YbhB/YbcL family protein
MERSSRAATGLSLRSTAFQPNAPIPARHTCDGEDLSPELAWDGPPAGVRTFALVVEDPDAPGGVFTHWVIFNLPPDARGLPEGVRKTERPDVGGMQGRNDFGNTGYNGPCPPPGPAHRYRFTLYALDAPVDTRSGMSKLELMQMMEGHIVARAELVGTYQRRR